MDNVIAIADSVGARIHEQGAHDSLIVFTEEQLNAFANKIATNSEVTKQLWVALSRIRRSALEHIESPSGADSTLLEYDIGTAYDVLEQSIKIFEEVTA
jgi:hypothetical protein